MTCIETDRKERTSKAEIRPEEQSENMESCWENIWNVAVNVKEINQPSLPTPFYSVLVSVSVFVALPTVFHSIYSPDNFPFSHSVLPVLSLPYRPFQLNVSL